MSPRPSYDRADATQNGAGGQCTTEEDFYPQYEEEEGAKELFPRRQPGAFPNIKVSRSGLQAALTRLQTLAAAPPAEMGGTAEAAFDPLRDGPLRYLGYANECGYVLLVSLTVHESRTRNLATLDYDNA